MTFRFPAPSRILRRSGSTQRAPAAGVPSPWRGGAPATILGLILLALLGGPQAVAGTQVPADTLDPVVTVDPAPEVELLADGLGELLAIYRRIDGLREIRIGVEGRILELSGTAMSAEDRERAGTLAAEVPGIVWVDNRIEVETDFRKRLTPAMERLREKTDRAIRFIPSFLLGLFIIGAFLGLAWLAGRWFFRPRKGDPNPFTRNLLRQSLRVVIGLVGIVLALELMAATALVGAVLGAAGVAGIAIGFAFRDIVENYLAGVLLSLRQPFSHNDHVEVGGHEGRVVRLTGRETILMTLDGNHVRIPNAMVFKSVMTNFTRNPRRRFVVMVGVAPSEPLGRALEAGRTTLAELAGVLETPAVSARVQGFGDSTVELRFSGWIDQTVADFSKVRSEATRAIKERFEALGIETPAPEYGVRILEDGRPEGGDAEKGLPGSPSSESPPKPSTPREKAGTADPQGAETPSEAPLAAPDVSPDRTIEDEISRELEESDEPDLLQRPSGEKGERRK